MRDRFEAELAKLNDVEQRAQFGPDTRQPGVHIERKLHAEFLRDRESGNGAPGDGAE